MISMIINLLIIIHLFNSYYIILDLLGETLNLDDVTIKKGRDHVINKADSSTCHCRGHIIMLCVIILCYFF